MKINPKVVEPWTPGWYAGGGEKYFIRF